MFGKGVLIFSGLLISALLGFWLFGERWRILLPSTRQGMHSLGLKILPSVRALHAYIYGRWSNQYVKYLGGYILPRLGPSGRQKVIDHYHGKVLTPEQARSIIMLNQDIPLRDLEQIIPYPTARDIVLSGPPEVAVYECPCRHSRPSPCRPTQVCMIIGQPFVNFILEHNPRSSRRLTQAEALDLLKGEHERGHLHAAWFKDVALNRFFAICNCCRCCCWGIEVMTRQGLPMMASSGYVAALVHDLCTGCGACLAVCPFKALSLEGKRIAIDWDRCMGCGACTSQCPHKALRLSLDKRKGPPLDVRLLVKGS
jgi:ferredoxin